MADDKDGADWKHKEYRLKQLEYLLRFWDGEAALLQRLTQILILGNGAAAGFVLIFLKDIKGKISEDLLFKALLAFMLGAALSGFAHVIHIVGAGLVKSRMLSYLFNDKDIAPLHKLVDRGIGVTFSLIFLTG